MKIILVSYYDESKELKEIYPDLEFERVINNHISSVTKLEGLRVTKVLVSPSVMVDGILPELFEILHGNFVRAGIGGHDAFEVIA